MSTNALELGIDIGALDVCGDGGLSGHDRGHLAAGRPRRPPVGPIGGGDGGEQRAAGSVRGSQPGQLFDASPERALIDPDNLHILVDHLKCAAFELPFGAGETFGRHDVVEILGVLAEQSLVHSADGQLDVDERVVSGRRGQPAVDFSSDNFVIVDTTRDTRVIGETDFTSGPATLHPKAIYIVEGRLYQVERFDFDGRKAFVREIDCDYYTDCDHLYAVSAIDTLDGRGSASRTARCTSSHGWWGSRRSSSTPTRTSAPANWTCPSSRCTPPPTG